MFTYNGTTWDLTGATTISGISATDLQDNFGITFTGTPADGDIITVKEKHYNTFACFVLDGNYRWNFGNDTTLKWSTYKGTLLYPVQYTTSNAGSCNESATYFFNYILNADISKFPAFNFINNLGKFVLEDGIIINPVMPNGYEMYQIRANRNAINSYDPSGLRTLPTSGNEYGYDTCIETNTNRFISLTVNPNYNFSDDYSKDADDRLKIVPIFEVPVM